MEFLPYLSFGASSMSGCFIVRESWSPSPHSLCRLLCVTLYPTWHRNMEKKGRNISGKIYNAVKMSLFTLPPTAHRAGVAAGLMQPAMRSSREPRIPVEVKRYEVYKLKTIGKFQYTSCIIS